MKNSFEHAKTKNQKKPFRFQRGEWDCPYILVPLIPVAMLYNKVKKARYDSLKWSEEKAAKVLNRTLPKVLSYDDELDEYSYCMGWSHWVIISNAPILCRGWARKFSRQLLEYLQEDYQNPNYEKTIVDDWGDIWVVFREKA